MFKRILIANRGEIALRIIRCCREMDIETVQVYSQADKQSLPVMLATYSVCIGPAKAADSYLKEDSIIEAARNDGRSIRDVVQGRDQLHREQLSCL